MKEDRRSIELLSPAKDAATAMAAISHGADAVYMGAGSHGARKMAANTIDDIRSVVEYAHPFRARVYATVNTLVYDNELREVEKLITSLYHAGVDAIIVQDLGILRLDIPPIALHASTQCDAVPLEKALFLEKMGFSQIVLPRELSIDEIKEYCEALTVPVECFVHGALCVSYSGRCSISQACLGRSGNRGECAQFCRMPYTLTDSRGKVMEKDKYLLSLRDFNASSFVEEMLAAGVSSFKIEGRLKDIGYVKNVTAAYREILDREMDRHPGKYVRSSAGSSAVNFEPRLEKSFNRGFTGYFLDGAPVPGSGKPEHPRVSIHTNKSLGEPLRNLADLHNSDGVSYFTPGGEYTGMRINDASRLPKELKGLTLYRTYDSEFEKRMARPDTAERKIGVKISIDEEGATIQDERGLSCRVALECQKDAARKPLRPEGILGKMGQTIYSVTEVENRLNPSTFIPASDLGNLRRRLAVALDECARATYPFDMRRVEDPSAEYFLKELDASGNVANRLAEELYRSHGVKEIERALETLPKGSVRKGDTLMTSRHCILRELGKCLRTPAGKGVALPLRITTGPHTFRLAFDCDKCQMRVLAD